jgi:hypothetical protein
MSWLTRQVTPGYRVWEFAFQYILREIQRVQEPAFTFNLFYNSMTMKFLPYSPIVISFAICLFVISSLPSSVQASTTIKLSRYEGYVGDKIEVSGEGFKAGQTVYIYYDDELQDDASVQEGSCHCRTTFTSHFTIPESCQGYHYIHVKTEGGRTSTAQFFINPRLSQNESSGHIGDDMEIRGSGFPCEGTGINIRYYLDINPHSKLDDSQYIDFPVTQVDALGSWEEEFSVPASIRGTHSIDAYYDNSEDTLAEVDNDRVSFDIEPTITLNAYSGHVGETIAVTGAGFAREDGDIRLRFGANEEILDKKVDEYGNWGPLSLTIPPCTKGEHLIEAFQGKSKTPLASAAFTAMPRISLSTATGHVGQTLSVTGTAFAPNTTINITYQDQTSAVATDASGILPAVTFTAKGKHGEQQLSANYDGSSVLYVIFSMEETPPDVTGLISPINAGRSGSLLDSFAGKICPTFEWFAATDASGISSYDMQIANSADFNAPVVSTSVAIGNLAPVDDIASYTLPREQGLSYGDYHWRVKAIDAAGNEGDWSAIQSFKAGWLPRWAMFAISAALLFLIIVIGLSIRRRRQYSDW